jgi:LacI family transcriptional regulator
MKYILKTNSINIYEIAKRAGLSTTTISRVINGSPHVNQETREKVQRIIEESGFVPNFFARGLNMKQTRTVGIVCTVISDINHATMVSAIEKYLRLYDFDTILCCVERNYESMARYFDMLINKHADAIFLVGLCADIPENINAIENLSKQIPVIVVNGVLEMDNVYNVVCNEKYMASSIVQKLCLSGYSHIAYIYDTTTYSGIKKLEGYRKGVEQCGLSNENLILQIPEDISMSDISIAAKKIVDFMNSFETMPDSIMTADDVLAVAALKAAALIGIELPVIGWYNNLFSQCCTPTISSVDIDLEKMGETAVLLLLNVLNKKYVPKCIEVYARWIERESYYSGLEDMRIQTRFKDQVPGKLEIP